MASEERQPAAKWIRMENRISGRASRMPNYTTPAITPAVHPRLRQLRDGQIAPRAVRRANGMTLIELIVATAILLVLTSMALPMARVVVNREKEQRLRHALHEMRSAIDRYKDAADEGAFQVKVGTDGYPPDLETLVRGVEGTGGRRYRFLRRIPRDPMTNSHDWGLRSDQDSQHSDSWGGQNVFDVYTRSDGTALDGTPYKHW